VCPALSVVTSHGAGFLRVAAFVVAATLMPRHSDAQVTLVNPSRALRVSAGWAGVTANPPAGAEFISHISFEQRVGRQWWLRMGGQFLNATLESETERARLVEFAAMFGGIKRFDRPGPIHEYVGLGVGLFRLRQDPLEPITRGGLFLCAGVEFPDNPTRHTAFVEVLLSTTRGLYGSQCSSTGTCYLTSISFSIGWKGVW
jgi:hypothetical protein